MNPDQASAEWQIPPNPWQISPSPFEEPIPNATPVVWQQGDFDIWDIANPLPGQSYVDTQYQPEPPLDISQMPAEPMMSESVSTPGDFLESVSEFMPTKPESVVQDPVVSEPVVSEPVVQMSDVSQLPPQASPFQDSWLQNIQEQPFQASPFQEQRIQEQEPQDASGSLENPLFGAWPQQIEQPPMNTQDTTTIDVLSPVWLGWQDFAQEESPQEDQNLIPATQAVMDEATAPVSDIQWPLTDSPFTDAEYKAEDQNQSNNQIQSVDWDVSPFPSVGGLNQTSDIQESDSVVSWWQGVSESDLSVSIDNMPGEWSLENTTAENKTSENTTEWDSMSSYANTSDSISNETSNTPDISMQEQLSPAVVSSEDEQSSDFDSFGDNSSQDEAITQQLPENVSQETVQDSTQDSTQEPTIQPSSDFSSIDMIPQEPIQEIPQDAPSESLVPEAAVSESVIPDATMSESAMIAPEPLTESYTPDPLEEEVLNTTAVSPVEWSTILPIVSDVIGEQLPTDNYSGMPVTSAFYTLGDSLKQLTKLGVRDATSPYILQGYNDEQTHIHYAFEMIDGGNSLTITKTTTSNTDSVVDVLVFAYDIMDFSLKVSLDGSEIYKEHESWPSDVSRQQLLLEKLWRFQLMIDEQIDAKQQQIEQQRQQAQAELEQQRKLQEEGQRISQQIENF